MQQGHLVDRLQLAGVESRHEFGDTIRFGQETGVPSIIFVVRSINEIARDSGNRTVCPVGLSVSPLIPQLLIY